jgi:hypothetical protein
MVLAVLVLRLGVSKAQAGLLNPLTLLAFVRGSLKVWLLRRCYQARVTESRRRHYVTHPSWGLPLFFGCLGSASAASGASRTRLLISRFKVRVLGGSPSNIFDPKCLAAAWYTRTISQNIACTTGVPAPATRSRWALVRSPGRIRRRVRRGAEPGCEAVPPGRGRSARPAGYGAGRPSRRGASGKTRWPKAPGAPRAPRLPGAAREGSDPARLKGRPAVRCPGALNGTRSSVRTRRISGSQRVIR